MSLSTTIRRIKTRASGFTLIELMIVVAIIGILSAVAYPAYGRYLVKNNRVAAQVYLMDLAQAQAQYMADTRSYATTIGELGMTTPAAVSSKYTIGIGVANGPPSTFTISAIPIAGGIQANDETLSINSAGTRLPAAKW